MPYSTVAYGDGWSLASFDGLSELSPAERPVLCRLCTSCDEPRREEMR